MDVWFDFLFDLIKFLFGTQNTYENRNENNTTMEITKVAAEVKATIAEGDKFFLELEKFVSRQDVSFFSEKMDTSKYIGKVIKMNYHNK